MEKDGADDEVLGHKISNVTVQANRGGRCEEGWDADRNGTCWERIPDGAVVKMKWKAWDKYTMKPQTWCQAYVSSAGNEPFKVKIKLGVYPPSGWIEY